ncbi:MAG: c-type cytochrome [Methylibium sp.]|nr:c-type cytochrome [Methylibium sp.]
MNRAPQHNTACLRARHGLGTPAPRGPLRPALFASAALALLLVGCDVLQGGAATPRPLALGDADRGLRLLSQYQCGSCHAIPGVPAAQGGIGPPLGAFGLRSYIAGQLPNVPDTLARWIADPAAVIPGTAMPDMGASEADARDMAAYLLSLR